MRHLIHLSISVTVILFKIIQLYFSKEYEILKFNFLYSSNFFIYFPYSSLSFIHRIDKITNKFY